MTVIYDEIHTGLAKAKADNLRAEAESILARTTVPSEVAKQRARLQDLNGVTIYRGAETAVVSASNARDMINSLGWSLMPTDEWRAAQASA